MQVRMRRRTGVLLVTIMVASVVWIPGAGSAAVGSFSDDDGSVHEGNIEAIAAEGITAGCNPPANDQFCPDDPVTRGQMAAFLHRALPALDASGQVAGFADIGGSVFAADIAWLAATGVTKGCNPPANDEFCPDDPVTRGQMAAFLVRALGLTASGSHEFVDDDSSVFEADIERLAEEGITLGCNPPDNDRFCPDDAITRAQMASFLARGLGLKPVPLYPIGTPGEEDVALVSRFHVYDDAEEPAYVFQMAYWPRSFASGVDVDAVPGSDGWQVDRVDDPGAYRGWDILSPPNHWGFDGLARDDDWMQFTLTRPARVAVAWRSEDPIPSWLKSGWTEGSGVTIDGDNARVYLRDFPAGPVAFGTVEAPSGDSRTMYTVLLAEADGSPTPTPPVPAGKTLPSVGGDCPAWVHGFYTTTGPDGQTYETWHPQWDPVYWCAFGHDHGSDPSLIPGAPAVPYGYVADKVPQDEPNAGFKEFTFKDMSGDYWVRFVIHANTASVRRACTQFHTLSVMIYDSAGVELMNVGFKADYGRAIAADGDEPLNPTNCGTTLPAHDDDRERQLNVAGQNHEYESWDSEDDTEATRNLGFGTFRHSFDIRNPITECVDTTCNSVRAIDRDRSQGENETQRTLRMARWDAGFSFTTAQSLDEGEFFTDPYGLGLVAESASNATRQFVDPGVSAVDFLKDSDIDRIDCKAWDPWTFKYTCYEIGDGGIDGIGNVPDLQIMWSISDPD